ncbi:unnamed protein product [Closterium sp. NIES-54]
MAATKRVLHYLCSTSGLGLVLGGQRPVVLTSHADASWVDDLATQRSSQGYTFSLGSGSVSWRSTRSSSVLSSGYEAEIYAGAMAAQELRWLTYVLTDLGESPRSPPVLYVDNKAMLALCREHRLEHRTKHIALRYFLARELQQPGQLRLAYVASQANTADIFTKALQPCDHQRFCTMLDGAVTLLEGMRLLNKDDGVDGFVHECTADVDLTEWLLFDDCDADEDAYRGVSSDRRVGEVEVHHFPRSAALQCCDFCGHGCLPFLTVEARQGQTNGGGFLGGGVVNSYGELKDAETSFVGLFVVKAAIVVEAGYFDDVVITVVAKAEGVLRGVRWW